MKKNHHSVIEQHGANAIIEALEPFVTDRRKARINSVLSHRLDSIHLAIECPSDINNALAAVRSSEALGVSTIHIITPESDAGSMRTVTQGAFYWTTIIFHQTLEDFLENIKKENRLLAGAIVDGPTILGEIPIENPLCLLVGNEQRGLSDEARNACDILYRIPMVGMSESLNLSVSAAISLYDITQRKRESLKQTGDLPETKKQTLKARYYMNSVNQRLIDATLV